MESYVNYPGGESMDEESEHGLVRLSCVRYEIAEGQPDAMGWRVEDVNGQECGYVSDLLADAVTGQILYVAVTDNDTEKVSLVPVEGSFLDTCHKTLVLSVPESVIANSPDFSDDVVDVSPFIDYWMEMITPNLS